MYSYFCNKIDFFPVIHQYQPRKADTAAFSEKMIHIKCFTTSSAPFKEIIDLPAIPVNVTGSHAILLTY